MKRFVIALLGAFFLFSAPTLAHAGKKEKAAKAEKKREAQGSFFLANKVEAIHHRLYTAALAAVKAGKPLPKVSYYVCQVCGNTVEGKPPAECPICGTPRSGFLKIE